MNCELNKINFWLAKNKISLNILKTNYLLIGNYPYEITSDKFVVRLQQKVINRVRNVTIKYQSMFIDDGLNWEHHIKQLSLYNYQNFPP